MLAIDRRALLGRLIFINDRDEPPGADDPSPEFGVVHCRHSAVQPPSSTSAEPVISEEASRGEEHDGAGHLVELAEAAEFYLRQHLVAKHLVLEERFCHRRFEERRSEAVDANVVRRKLDRHRLGETFHGVLGRAIDGAARGADMAHLRRDIDDGAGQFCFDEAARHRLRHEERGAHVERKDRVEILDLDVGQIGRSIHPGIIDQNLKRRGGGDRAPHGFDVGHVQHQRIGAIAARADRGRGFLDLGLGARRERDLRAGRRQGRRRRKPDAAPAAGD